MLTERQYFLFEREVTSHSKSFDQLAMCIVNFNAAHHLFLKSSHDEVSDRKKKVLVVPNLSCVLAPLLDDHLEPKPLR